MAEKFINADKLVDFLEKYRYNHTGVYTNIYQLTDPTVREAFQNLCFDINNRYNHFFDEMIKAIKESSVQSHCYLCNNPKPLDENL